MKSMFAGIALASSALLLAGCAEPSVSEEFAGVGQNAQAPQEGFFSLGHIKSCDQVEPFVAAYIEGLVPVSGNAVSKWGVNCTWETAEGETDFANVRSVEILLEPRAEGSEKPDTSFLDSDPNGEVLEDPWLDSNGGVAFSSWLGTSVVGAVSSVVWVPGVEAKIAGGKWAGMPALDGAAALQIVKGLLSQ